MKSVDYKRYRFIRLTDNLSIGNSTMKFTCVTAIETTLEYNDDLRGGNFLYDDIMAYDFSPETFIEINRIFVDPNQRRYGIGSKLIDLVKEKFPDVPIFVKAGILDETLYDLLIERRCLLSYIYENIVPFYEKNGFIDVNNTTLAHSENIIMCYPESIAQRYINES